LNHFSWLGNPSSSLKKAIDQGVIPAPRIYSSGNEISRPEVVQIWHFTLTPTRTTFSNILFRIAIFSHRLWDSGGFEGNPGALAKEPYTSSWRLVEFYHRDPEIREDQQEQALQKPKSKCHQRKKS
jgi:hypothetical protein